MSMPNPDDLMDHFFGGALPPPVPAAVAPVGSAPPSRRSWWKVPALLLACALVSGGVAYGTVRLDNSRHGVSFVSVGSGGAQDAASTDLHALLAKVQPAVAAVEISEGATTPPTPIAAGSGVVISADGLMITNAHVVSATDQNGTALKKLLIMVKMADGTVRTAKVLGSSPLYDVALLRLDDTANLHPLVLADSSKFRVGDHVVAIGNALDLGDAPTVTTGIISALDRTLTESSSITLHELIQTDAAINHGNSGGALVNMSGELVGINSAGIPDAQNIGFAISVGTISRLLDDLKAGRTPKAAAVAYIGVNLAEVPNGLSVTKVQEGSPANVAGIKEGDVITMVDGTKVSTHDQLSALLRSIAPGTKVSLTVLRDGVPKKFSVTLAARP
jgi:putative serine protease PepD